MHAGPTGCAPPPAHPVDVHVAIVFQNLAVSLPPFPKAFVATEREKDTARFGDVRVCQYSLAPSFTSELDWTVRGE